jgi:hypothetical protein
VFVVSGTPTRLLGTRHLFQALSQRDTSEEWVCVVSGTPTRLLSTRLLLSGTQNQIS